MQKTAILYLAIISMSIFLFSCSAITRSQKSIIETFAISAKTYSEAPKELLNTYSECLYKNAQLEAATMHNDDQMVRQLDLSSKDYFKRADFTSDFVISYQLINKYFQALIEFLNVDSAKDFKTNIASLGSGIDSLISKSKNAKITLIPLGFGSISATLIQYIGQTRIRQQQLKYFKQFIAKGDILLEKTSLVLNEIVIGSLIKGELEKGDNYLKDIYLLFLSNLDSSDRKTDALYNELNPKYLEIKTCFGRGLLLLAKISETTQRLTVAHKEMINLLATKKSKLTGSDIALFTDKAAQLADIIKEFRNPD